jgi:hypothetical protein
MALMHVGELRDEVARRCKGDVVLGVVVLVEIVAIRPNRRSPLSWRRAGRRAAERRLAIQRLFPRISNVCEKSTQQRENFENP